MHIRRHFHVNNIVTREHSVNAKLQIFNFAIFQIGNNVKPAKTFQSEYGSNPRGDQRGCEIDLSLTDLRTILLSLTRL